MNSSHLRGECEQRGGLHSPCGPGVAAVCRGPSVCMRQAAWTLLKKSHTPTSHTYTHTHTERSLTWSFNITHEATVFCWRTSFSTHLCVDAKAVKDIIVGTITIVIALSCAVLFEALLLSLSLAPLSSIFCVYFLEEVTDNFWLVSADDAEVGVHTTEGGLKWSCLRHTATQCVEQVLSMEDLFLLFYMFACTWRYMTESKTEASASTIWYIQ